MKSALRISIAIFLFLIGLSPVLAAHVDTVSTFSPCMRKTINAVVITPEGYLKTKTNFPVVYLLHGYGGNYASFIKAIPELRTYADAFRQILICADGAVGSWYFDSPVDPSWKYETYIADELVKWVDKNYRTIKDRKGRGITGFSMGGHGALYLAFKHQDVFGTAGSMSGGVDFRPFPRNWEIGKRLGSYAEFPERWAQNSVVNMIGMLSPGSLALIIDCGTADFFFAVNENFHAKLLESGIAHDYITRPGAHNWRYWRNSINYQLLFMNKYFNDNSR